MMSAMKSNYLELQHGQHGHRSETVNGAYVTFVQQVVELFQQYTTDICPVDKFFTDSAAFPLPAADPTYVIGRLRGYGARMSDAGTVKKLAIFSQSVAERAAVDGQQAYLVSQFCAAASRNYERGEGQQPSLRSVLLQIVFPGYIEAVLKTSCGWILGKPILLSCITMLENLVYGFSVTDKASAEAALDTLTSILATLHQTVELVVNHSGLLEQAHILMMVALFFQAVAASISSLDYIQRHHGGAKAALTCIDFFASFADFVASMICGEEDVPAPYTPDEISLPYSPFMAIRTSCAASLNEALCNKWKREGEAYFVTYGSTRKQVPVQLGSVEVEQTRVLVAIEEFRAALQSMGRPVLSGMNEVETAWVREGLELGALFI